MNNERNIRLLEIFFRALHGEGISVKKMAEEYGVSTKSISRNINDLQNFLADHRVLMQNATLEYCYKEKAYILYSDEFLKNQELLAMVKILIGSRAINKGDLLRIVAKLKKFTTIREREKLDNIIRKEIYHYHEVNSDCKSVIDNLWKIVSAIYDKNFITITYYKMNRNEVKRKIRPTAVMFSEYYFYLIAYKDDDPDYKPIYYRIDRITSIVEHREKFFIDREHNFDEGDLREKNQFMFPGENVRICFEFSGLSLQAILDRLPTAKVVEKKDGGISVIEAEVNNGKGILMYLLSQGAWVKVISPPKLVEDMKKEIHKMISLYE